MTIIDDIIWEAMKTFTPESDDNQIINQAKQALYDLISDKAEILNNDDTQILAVPLETINELFNKQ